MMASQNQQRPLHPQQKRHQQQHEHGEDGWSDLITLRPGRTIFARKTVVFNKGGGSGQGNTNGGGGVEPDGEKMMQLVCLHGTCASEKQYHMLLQSLSEQFGRRGKKDDDIPLVDGLVAYTYDMVGCGQSPVVYNQWDAYDNRETIRDLQAIVERLVDPNHPYVLVGHSSAGNIVLPFLAQQQHRHQTFLLRNLFGVVLLSTCVRGSPESRDIPWNDGGHIVMRLPVFILRCLRPAMNREFARLSVYHGNRERLAPFLMPDMAQNDMYMAKAYHRHLVWCNAQQHLVPLVRSGAVPRSLVIHGVHDGIIGIEYGQKVHNAFVSAAAAGQGEEGGDGNQSSTKSVKNSAIPCRHDFVSVEEAGHMVMLEQPDQVAKSIMDFLLVPDQTTA